MKKILILLVLFPLVMSAQNITNLSSKDFSNRYNSFVNNSTVIILDFDTYKS